MTTPPTPDELALPLAEHAANLERACQGQGVASLYRGWYAMGHHLGAVHRALYAEARVRELEARLAELTAPRCCPECKGTGQVWVDSAEYDGWTICRKCMGKGVLKRD